MENGQKAGDLSLSVKRDERVGVWWLDGVDVSVMAWCQTLCLCHFCHTNLFPKFLCFKIGVNERVANIFVAVHNVFVGLNH